MMSNVFELADLAPILRRHWRWAAGWALITCLAAFGFLALAPRQYVASTLMQLAPASPGLSGAAGDGLPRQPDATWIESEVAITGSENVALQMIADYDLATLLAEQPGIGAKLLGALAPGQAAAGSAAPELASIDNTLRDLQRKTQVRRLGLSALIEIRASAARPELAAFLANARARTRIALAETEEKSARDRQQRLIAARIAGLDGQIAAKQAALDANLISAALQMDGPIATLAARIAGLPIAGTATATAGGNSAPAGPPYAFDSDDGWQRLVDAATGADAADAALTALDAQIAARNGKAAALPDVAHGLSTDRAALTAQLRSAFPFTDAIAIRHPELPGLLRDLADLRAMREDLSRTGQQAATLAELRQPDLKIVALAVAPSAPSFPRTLPVMLVAFAIAAGGGAGIAALREHLLRRIGDARTILGMTGHTPAAQLPDIPADHTGRTSIADIVVDEPNAPFSRGIAALRAGIDEWALGARRIAADAASGLVVVVTSAGPGEGKTVTALALARSFAAAGRRSLLIDGNLQAPDLAGHLALRPVHGLAEFLQRGGQDGDLMDFYFRDPASRAATLLSAAPAQAASDQLLNGPVFSLILQQARAAYDVTIIDAPALMSAVDARYLARKADLVVFAARQDWTTEAEFLSAYAQLCHEGAPSPNILTVLNRAPAPWRGLARPAYSAAT